ncbi:MAG: FixH family protein [Marinosulfonomonas sp.]
MSQKELTGGKVFAIFAGAFGVIISVNLVLAYNAVATFPGLEVKNSYVASQTFDQERKAQLALGWDVKGAVQGDQLLLSIRDENDQPVQAASLTATLGRATNVKEDQTPEFVFNGTSYVAPVDLAPGNWNLRMKAIAKDGTPFHQRVVLHVRAAG